MVAQLMVEAMNRVAGDEVTKILEGLFPSIVSHGCGRVEFGRNFSHFHRVSQSELSQGWRDSELEPIDEIFHKWEGSG